MQSIISFLSQFSIPQLGINFLDIIFIIVIIFYAHEGYTLGFTLAMLDLVSFISSFIVALKSYIFIAKVLVDAFSLPIGFANAGGFFLTAFITEIVLHLLFRKLFNKFPTFYPNIELVNIFKKVDHHLGIVPGIVSAFIVLSFILSVIVSLPTSPLIKNIVTGSGVGSRLIKNTSFFENKLNGVFGGALNETLNFLTVEPQSNESVNLRFRTSSGTVDQKAEQEMFRLVNIERVKAGVNPLTFDNGLQSVARAHSRDMLQRGYFSHYTPEGKTPFDRMNEAGIDFLYAGENLALAPDTNLAMQGLMNSLGHRKNILSPNFGRIGIGVIDSGIYGKMYSQEFTN